jgi:hypothetical protein
MHRGFCWGNLNERGHLESLGLYVSAELKWIPKNRTGCGGLDSSG